MYRMQSAGCATRTSWTGDSPTRYAPMPRVRARFTPRASSSGCRHCQTRVARLERSLGPARTVKSPLPSSCQAPHTDPNPFVLPLPCSCCARCLPCALVATQTQTHSRTDTDRHTHTQTQTLFCPKQTVQSHAVPGTFLCVNKL